MLDDELKYISIHKEDGEVIAHIPINENEEIICKNEYVVALGYGEPLYEERDGKVYAVDRDDEVEVPKSI